MLVLPSGERKKIGKSPLPLLAKEGIIQFRERFFALPRAEINIIYDPIPGKKPKPS
jgi:hypothetical protein